MKIVVFGSTGFVGRSLVTHLVEHNHSVILVNRSNHYHSHAKSIVVSSLFDSHLYHNELSSADAVIYLSGLAHIDSKLNSDDLNLYLSNNYYLLLLFPIIFHCWHSLSISVLQKSFENITIRYQANYSTPILSALTLCRVIIRKIFTSLIQAVPTDFVIWSTN